MSRILLKRSLEFIRQNYLIYLIYLIIYLVFLFSSKLGELKINLLSFFLISLIMLYFFEGYGYFIPILIREKDKNRKTDTRKLIGDFFIYARKVFFPTLGLIILILLSLVVISLIFHIKLIPSVKSPNILNSLAVSILWGIIGGVFSLISFSPILYAFGDIGFYRSIIASVKLFVRDIKKLYPVVIAYAIFGFLIHLISLTNSQPYLEVISILVVSLLTISFSSIL